MRTQASTINAGHDFSDGNSDTSTVGNPVPFDFDNTDIAASAGRFEHEDMTVLTNAIQASRIDAGHDFGDDDSDTSTVGNSVPFHFDDTDIAASAGGFEHENMTILANAVQDNSRMNPVGMSVHHDSARSSLNVAQEEESMTEDESDELDFYVSPIQQTVYAGQNVEISCHTFLPVEWLFDGNTLPPNAKVVDRVREDQLSILQFQPVTVENSGEYICIQENDNDMGIAILEVEFTACSKAPPLEHGKVLTNGYDFGNILSYQCDEGYERSGIPTRTCLSDGQWSGSPPTCTNLASSALSRHGTSVHFLILFLMSCLADLLLNFNWNFI